MTAALVDRRSAAAYFLRSSPICIKKGRELIKEEKSSDGKSINLVDLPFFSLETVITEVAILAVTQIFFCQSCHNHIRKFLIVIIRKLGAAMSAHLLMKINDPHQNSCTTPK